MRANRFVILDTSFLIEAVSSKINLIDEFKRVLPGVGIAIVDQTHYELKQLATRDKTKTAQLAKLVLAILAKKPFLTLTTTEDQTVDELIVDLVQSDDRLRYVATLDRALRSILKKLGVQTVVIRQRRYIALE